MNITGLIFIIVGLYIFSELNRKILGLLIISISLHLFIYKYKLNSIYNQEQMTNWKNEASLKLHAYLKKDFGSHWIGVNKENGFAIWKKSKSQLIYDKIIVKDEIIQYEYENKKYENNLHLYVHIYIPLKYLTDILNKYANVSYIKPTFTLYIICKDMKNGNEILLKILKQIHLNNYNNIINLLKLNRLTYKEYIESKKLF